MKKLNLILVSLFAAAMALSGATVAQQAPPQPEPATDVSKAELQQFADASASVVAVQEDYSARLQQVEDPERASKLQQEANEEMVGAVKEAGLDVESFNAIAMAVQNDPKLQKQLDEVSP